MRLPSVRPLLPALMVCLAVACGPKPDAPATTRAEQAPAPANATEERVSPGRPVEPAAAPSDAPATVVPPATPGTPARQVRKATAPVAAAPVDEAPAGETLPAPGAPGPGRETGPTPAPPRPVPVRMVTVPADTPLQLTLLTDVASDTSAVEDRVEARVADALVVDGETVVPAGAVVGGVVTYAQASGKVKGRAALTIRFRTVTIGSRTYDLTAEPVRREASGTKAKDARNIGIGAGPGAVIGGIIGGRKGAGIGAAVGGAGGTGVVLATKGEEVRLPSGSSISTRLDAPLVVETSPERR